MVFSRNMPGIDILASDVNHDRKITIQVKIKTVGDWETGITRGKRWDADPLGGQLATRSSGVGRVHGLGMAYQRVDLDIGDQSGVSIVH